MPVASGPKNKAPSFEKNQLQLPAGMVSRDDAKNNRDIWWMGNLHVQQIDANAICSLATSSVARPAGA